MHIKILFQHVKGSFVGGKIISLVRPIDVKYQEGKEHEKLRVNFVTASATCRGIRIVLGGNEGPFLGPGGEQARAGPSYRRLVLLMEEFGE